MKRFMKQNEIYIRNKNAGFQKMRVSSIIIILVLCIGIFSGCNKNDDITEEIPAITEVEAAKAAPTATEIPTATPTPTPTPFVLNRAYEEYMRDDVYRIPMQELSANWGIMETDFAGDYALFWLMPPWKENEEERKERDVFVLIMPEINKEQYRTVPDFSVGKYAVMPDGQVILEDLDSGNIHVYDNTLSETGTFAPGAKENFKTVGISDRGIIWTVDEKNTKLIAINLKGDVAGEYPFDSNLSVCEYQGLIDECECFHAILNDEENNGSYLYLSVSSGEITYRSANDPELGEEWDNNWVAPDSVWEISYSESTWFIHEPGYGRKGYAFPKSKTQEGITFSQNNMFCFSTLEWNDDSTYNQEYRLLDIEKGTVSDTLREKEFTDYNYMSARGAVGAGNVLLTGSYENGCQDLILWTAGKKTAPVEKFYDFTIDNPEKCLEYQIKELKEKYNIVITPDKEEEGKSKPFSDIMIELEFVNTFLLSAKNDPNVVKPESGTEIHPENMRNNEGAHYAFNPHVISGFYLKEHGEKRRDVFYNYVDALRAGEDRFKCPDIGSANWACGRLAQFFFPLGYAYADAQYSGNGWAEIEYKIPKEEFLEKERDFEDRICEILNDVIEEDYTDLEKALALYEFMTEYCTYDYEMLAHNRDLDSEWIDRQSLYRCLMEKQGICWEIACLYQYLLLQCDVDIEESAGEPVVYGEDLHAWNYITLDGQGYLIDATWGLTSDRSPDLAYFLFTDERRETRDGYKSESFDIGGYGLYGARKKYSFDADDERYSELWFGRYVAFDRNEKCIFYRDINGDLKRFDYGK